MRVFLYLIFIFVFLGCHSPKKHRLVDSGRGSNQEKIETMGFKDFDINIEVQWLSGPFGNKDMDSQLLVISRNSEGELINLPEGYIFSFMATMPSMGHPLHQPGSFVGLGGGLYLNKSIRYNMDKEWQNQIFILDGDYNIKDEVVWHDYL